MEIVIQSVREPDRIFWKRFARSPVSVTADDGKNRRKKPVIETGTYFTRLRFSSKSIMILWSFFIFVIGQVSIRALEMLSFVLEYFMFSKPFRSFRVATFDVFLGFSIYDNAIWLPVAYIHVRYLNQVPWIYLTTVTNGVSKKKKILHVIITRLMVFILFCSYFT